MARTFQVTFDAGDPASLAEFWAEALGYIEQPPPEGFDSWEAFAEAIDIPASDLGKYAALVDPDGQGPRVFFQQVPEGKTAKNRAHLDVNVADPAGSPDERRREVDVEVARLVGLGAEFVVAHDEPIGVWTMLRDPEGNEFCVQ